MFNAVVKDVYKIFLRLVLLLSYSLFLAGCSLDQSPMISMAKKIYDLKTSKNNIALNPAYRYLRTTVSGHVLYLALGSVETTPRGTVETWYSGDREILRLSNGRIVNTAGLSTDWRETFVKHVPTWKSALKHPKHYLRVRDVMPGYRFGIRDHITLRAILPPKKSMLVAKNPNQFAWFEEVANTSEADMGIPPVRYAVEFNHQEERVIYSEQCLSIHFCVTFQQWSANEVA